MNATLLKALLAVVPIAMLLIGSAVMFAKRKNLSSLLQLLGTACLIIVVAVHICEALGLFRFMGWGEEHSIGHYLDLASVLLGLTLFPIGYLIHAVTLTNQRHDSL
jgi:hypothetical protein